MIPNESSDAKARQDYPQFPGEEFLSHTAAVYQEQMEARFASRGILASAQGFESEAAKAIVDIDLNQLPALPASHRDHERRNEARIKYAAQNKANARKRFTITMQEWTSVYTALKESTEHTAPVLSRELKDMCDLAVTQNIAGGYFDGPRAWAIVRHRLAGGSLRTEADKDFYRNCEYTQRANRLPDGCLATEYSRKALAFLAHIKPNLPQQYAAAHHRALADRARVAAFHFLRGPGLRRSAL